MGLCNLTCIRTCGNAASTCRRVTSTAFLDFSISIIRLRLRSVCFSNRFYTRVLKVGRKRTMQCSYSDIHITTILVYLVTSVLVIQIFT